MPDPNRILTEMTELAERMTVLARSWRQAEGSEGSEGGPRTATAVSSARTPVEVDSVAARLRSIRLSDRTGLADTVQTLHYDVAAREAVDLATGILMEQHGLDAEAALALLERLTGQVPVETVADEMVRDQAEESSDQTRPDVASDPVAARAKDASSAESREG